MEKHTGRVEAFSDGVFAIAITLLILEIRVPHLPATAGNLDLLSAIGALWPSFVAFVLSFWVVLVMWINHHELFHLVRDVDHVFLMANGFLLLMVTFVPFPTALLASALGTPTANAATAFYCGTFVMTSLSYNALFATIARGRRLVVDSIDDASLARVRKAYRMGLAVYLAATVLACFQAVLGLLLCMSLWILWTRLCYVSERRR